MDNTSDMASCDRCRRYVSPDYVRVFGDNQNQLDSCPDCRAKPTRDAEPDAQGESDRTVTFRMSDFESEEGTDGESEDRRPSSATGKGSEASTGTRLGRLGSAVSDLF
jgi:hypothetical protein